MFMSEPAYPAARSVAARVQALFARHIAAARSQGRTDLSDVPESADIEALIDAAFWASLRREEGATPTISLALLPPEGASRRRLPNWRRQSSGRGFISESGAAMKACASGAPAVRFLRSASSSRSSRQGCWSSSTATIHSENS
jgi:Probable sensor domain DACNV